MLLAEFGTKRQRQFAGITIESERSVDKDARTTVRPLDEISGLET